jgi:hypothetical protein
VDPQSGIRFPGVIGTDTGAVVRIKSMRRLKIEKAEFQFKDGGTGMEWKTVLPISYEVTLVDSTKTPKGKPDKKGKEKTGGKPFVYQIRMHLKPELMTDQWGDILLTTDFTEKKEIKLSGVLEAKK